jgi:hypothetical protein
MADTRCSMLSVIAVAVLGAAGCEPEPGGGPCNPVPNGCGPNGWLSAVVPECPLGLPCFTPACNGHDICYSTCGSDRRACDAAFYRDMLSICADSLAPGGRTYERCRDVAYIYWLAVDAFGQPYFAGGQQEVCACDNADPAARLAILMKGGRFDGIAADGPIRQSGLDAPVPPFDDADGDWLPDEWELANGLDPTDPSDAWSDLDGDGIVNLHEFIDGTDPGRANADLSR